MKWTRSFDVVKVLLLAVLAAGLNAKLASAQGYQGKFTLPFEARWGRAILPPGEYSFSVDPGKAACIATVSQGQHYIALVMSSGVIEQGELTGPSALIAVRSGGTYRIEALRLAEAGVTLGYPAPKAERQVLAQGPQLIRRVAVLVAAK